MKERTPGPTNLQYQLCGYDRCGYDRAATCATTALYDASPPPDARDATHDTFDVNAD